MVTDKYARAEVRLREHVPAVRAGETLAGWLKAHRDDGMSWRWISIELARITGVTVTDVTLAEWYRQSQRSVSYQVDPFKLCQ